MANFFDRFDSAETTADKTVETPTTVPATEQGNFFDKFDRPKSVVVKQTEAALEPKQKTAADFEVKLPKDFKVSEDAIVQRVKEKEIPFKDLYSKPENLQIIREYGETRFGDSGKQKPNESDEDYAKRFMTAMRQVEWNTTLNAVPELNWLSNAKPEELVKAARAHNLYDKTPDWYEEGGQPGIRPFAEATFSAVSEPTNILSAGIGAGARYAVARQAIKNTLATKLKAAGIGAAAETVIGVGQNVIDQSVKRKTGVQEDKFDPYQMLLAGALSSIGGGVEAYGGVARRNIKTSRAELEEKLASKKKAIPTDKATENIVDVVTKANDEIFKEYDIFEGRKVLNKLSPETELTESQIKKDVSRRAVEIAGYIMDIMPEYARKSNQKVSDAVANVFDNIDNIDNDILDAAISRAGITPAEFSQAARTTVGDAANVMQAYSTLAKTLNKMSKLDPEAQKLVDEMYGSDHEAVSMMGNGLRAISRLERESKALVVSGIGTTVRNVLGTGTALTFDAAYKLMEGTLYTTGKAITGLATGTYTKGDISRGLKQTVGDTFATLSYLTNAGLTAETVDLLLKNNPNLNNKLFSALQESDKADLSKVARVVNTLNVAQDTYFRRAIFAASVQRQLSRVGIDMFDVLANNKQIPVDILKNATDETLKATFSYQPKYKGFKGKSAEDMSESAANMFVKFFENIPGGSLAITFPRFMSNAMAFQYKYSPLGEASGAMEMAQGAYRIAKGQEGGDALINRGMEKLVKGAVGTQVIYAAYKYRLENQDSEWYNVTGEDGSTVDIRGVFPIGPYLAVGDFIAKQKLGRTEDAKLSELAEAIVGMKMPAGTQASILDQLPDLIAGTEGKATERAEKAIGRIIGDFVGRFVTPGKPVFEYFDLFDEEAQKARDPNVITTPVTEETNAMLDTAKQRVMAKVPGLKEELPEFQPYFSDQTPVRAGEFFSTLTGTRITPRKNEIEREFVKLNINPYKYFGSTGDKVYDRAVILASVPSVEMYVGERLKDKDYQDMSVDQKRIAIKNNMQIALAEAREQVQAEMSDKDLMRIHRLKYNKLPAEDRRAINELYSQEHGGRTIDDTKDYEAVYEYEAMLDQFR
jgi:uncharacterized OsmC-like protein